jgi:hypothetical protein
VNSASQRVTSLRQKGYVFERKLEEQAASHASQWKALHPGILQQINLQAASLQSAIRPLETQMTQLTAASRNPLAAKPLLNTLTSQVDMLESKIKAAEDTIRGSYNQLASQVDQFNRHLDEIDYLLTNLGEASFQLLPTEGGVAAVKAVWCRSGKEHKDDPEGNLFLTDQRLLFEQKQEVATKKVLFIATEKQKIQSLQWEAPVAMLDQVSTSKQGLLKNEDHIEIRMKPGAPFDSAHLHIWRDCEAWQALLHRARDKDFDKDRAIAIDQAEVDKVRAAPTQCSACGAVMKAVILRGQDSVKCEYCGAVTRL